MNLRYLGRNAIMCDVVDILSLRILILKKEVLYVPRYCRTREAQLAPWTKEDREVL